ncbi:MAG: heme exporter protein CcmB, partial [Deltaproteobacteria bacterium]|nr:heme exporter protein CcmB [Deltaproteobacteria bacterium]
MTALRQIWVLLWKDLMIDLRRKENIIAMFFFSLLTLMVFRFALGEDSEPRYRLSPRVMAVQALREVPGEIRQDLENLSGRMFTGREALLDALNKLPSGPAPGAVRIAILENARTSTLSESAAGLLWVTVLLAGVLGLSRSFTQEKEHGCMDGLLLTPVSRGVLYLGKMLSNALFLVLILVLLMPLFALFFQVGLGGILGPMSVVLLGGVLGFSALGTL